MHEVRLSGTWSQGSCGQLPAATGLPEGIPSKPVFNGPGATCAERGTLSTDATALRRSQGDLQAPAMGDTGIEPVTSCVSYKHSNQLS